MFARAVSFCFCLLICSSSLTITDSRTITLNCTKPTENGSCTMLYAIDRQDIADGSRKGSGVTENALYGIGSLEARETYEVSANPLNINNNTSEAETTNITTPDENIDVTTPADVSCKIQNLTVEADTHTIILNWTKPTENGNCAVRYDIEWKAIADGSKNGTGDTECEFYVIDNLDACETYEVSVNALNVNNDTSEAEITNITTLADVPGKIQNLTVEADTHTIILNWTKPTDIGSCAVHYAIEWKAIADGSKNGTGDTDCEFYVIDNLDACETYEVSVNALNVNNDTLEAEITNITTPADVPGKIQNLTVEADTHTIKLNWTKPTENGNCAVRYDIEWKAIADGSKSGTGDTECEFYVIDNLDACETYEVSVNALNVNNDTSEAEITNITTPADVPGKIQNLIVEADTHTIKLNWTKPTENGNCAVRYDIEWKAIADGSRSGTCVTECEFYVIDNLDACETYEVSVNALTVNNDTSEAEITNITTPADVIGAPAYKCTSCLETEKVCLVWELPDLSSNRCKIYNATVTCNAVDNPELPVANGETQDFKNDSFVVNVFGLSPSTSYSCVAYVTNESGPSKKSSDLHFTTEGEVPVGMIVGVLFAIIAIGLIAVVVVTYHQGTLVWPPKLFTRAKQATVRPQPVLLKKFPEYCAQMLDTPTRLGSEYQLLATLSADISEANTCVNGQLPENRRKNRYINILPYDATRVTLDLIDGDPTSHYINASFIKGYSDDIEYIATQGPKEETCLDFWRMVFQHDVRVIVMVTNLMEQDKVKCDQYYPNRHENEAFGDMTIRCTAQTEFPIHTARTLVLMKGDRKRTLSHLHFREWPDFGVPQSTDVMIHFCQTMRHHALAAELGLILVHCSAGVGRTGTLIAVDILLQHICENKKVDIFGTVFKLRKQRVNMVQTEGQYTYIYRCIKDAVQDPTIVNPGTVSNNQLEPIYENVGTSLNTLQYEKLPKWRNKDDEA